MRRKTVVLLRAAELDIAAATKYLQEESSTDITLRLLTSLEQALLTISEQPAIGSPRFAHELDLPGLGSWLLQDFPYVIFYMDLIDHVQVWRVLHSKVDLGAWLEE